MGVTLNDNEATHMWKPEASGLFSTRSAYRSFFFIGSITFEPWNKVRKSWAPGKCKTFVWLAIRNRCWTTDRLQKRGLPHPEHCPLRSGGKNSTLLISCVFARQFWYAILQPINLSRLTDWWKHAERRLPKQHRKGFNSLCTWGLDPLEA